MKKNDKKFSANMRCREGRQMVFGSLQKNQLAHELIYHVMFLLFSLEGV